MKLERTKNGIRNLIWGLISKVIGIMFPFFLRTVFIYSLGVEYLGLNSLFTSILTVLNLGELGFSSAIIYNMYKPIAENDHSTICALMQYYKKVYHRIGSIIFIIGLLLIPFLKYLINGSYPDDINLSVLFILFLLNTTSSYFLFAYKNCVLIAYQREDIISRIQIAIQIFMYAVQGIVLIVFKSYYIFVVISLLNTIVSNVLTAYYSDKLYPMYQPKGGLPAEQKAKIRQNIKGIMVGKICMVSRNAFDNIFLSMFLGLQVVTIYGNYYYIMKALGGILIVFMTSIGAGIGNSIETESVQKNHKDYMKFTFMYSWISGWCTICLFCLFQPFMKIWMGEDLLFPMVDVALLCLYFYSLTLGDVRSQYSAATGLFWQNRHYVLTEAVMNIVLNYFLGKWLGVRGIILATWLTIFFINFLWGASVIYKYYFTNFNVLYYYKKQLWYLFVIAVVALITYYLSSFISINLYSDFILILLLCIVLPNLLLYLFYRKSSEFADSILFLKNNILSKFFREKRKKIL